MRKTLKNNKYYELHKFGYIIDNIEYSSNKRKTKFLNGKKFFFLKNLFSKIIFSNILKIYIKYINIKLQNK
jgi:hypothetical protein